MREYFDAPDRDRYQIITEHERGQIIAEDTGLGFERTDDIVIVQILSGAAHCTTNGPHIRLWPSDCKEKQV